MLEYGADPRSIDIFNKFFISKDMRKHINMLQQQAKNIEKKQPQSIKNTKIYKLIEKFKFNFNQYKNTIM